MRVTDLYSDALGPTPLLHFTPTLLDLPSKFPEPCCGTTRKLTVSSIAVAEHAFDRQARYGRMLKKVERYSRHGGGFGPEEAAGNIVSLYPSHFQQTSTTLLSSIIHDSIYLPQAPCYRRRENTSKVYHAKALHYHSMSAVNPSFIFLCNTRCLCESFPRNTPNRLCLLTRAK